MLAATGGESEGRLGWWGRPKAEATQGGCAANVQKAVGSALSMCGELRGDSRSDEARGSNGVWRVTGEGGTSRQSEVKESPECVYIFRIIVKRRPHPRRPRRLVVLRDEVSLCWRAPCK